MTDTHDLDLPMDDEAQRISTGSEGLDNILGCGLDPNRMYLYEGSPGSGKTTIALQFLLEGVRRGERVLYVTLSETKAELELVAKRHGWSLDGIDVFELVSPETSLDPELELTVLHPAEMELSETTQQVFDRVSETNPTRVIFDSLSEMRLLAQSPLRYRRQVLALKHFFTTRRCTVILLDDQTSEMGDLQLHSISHGVVLLEQLAIDYGAERRRLRVIKMRGIQFRGGYHDFVIRKGGLQIYPRLIAAEHRSCFVGEVASSGNEMLDRMLGGGLERGTNALLVGAELPKGEARKPYLVLITALCQCYWVAGTVLGALAGAFIHINTKGLDFMLTALFLVLAIDLFKKYRAWEPFALGAVAGVLALLVGGQALMMPVALAIVLAVLSLFRGFFESKLDARGGAGA